MDIGGGQMDKTETKKAFDEWFDKEYERIKQEAKENGTWCYYGLDANQHLFKALYEEAKEKLNTLSSTNK